MHKIIHMFLDKVQVVETLKHRVEKQTFKPAHEILIFTVNSENFARVLFSSFVKIKPCKMEKSHCH